MNSSSDVSIARGEPIGGWLILFAIGLVIYPVRAAFSIATHILPAFSPATWAILTSPGAEGYHPLWKPLLIIELGVNSLLAACAVWLLVWFFRRRRMAPMLAIAFLAFNFAYVGLDAVFARNLPGMEQTVAIATLMDVVRTGVACLIWMPYFVVSRRVKRTFVR